MAAASNFRVADKLPGNDLSGLLDMSLSIRFSRRLCAPNQASGTCVGAAFCPVSLRGFMSHLVKTPRLRGLAIAAYPFPVLSLHGLISSRPNLFPALSLP